MIELRNNVTHKGPSPSSEVAMTYAECVYHYIIGATKLLRTKFDEEIDAICRNDLAEMKASMPLDILYKSVAVPTMIWLSGPKEKFSLAPFAEVFSQRREDHGAELQERIEELDQQEEDQDD